MSIGTPHTKIRVRFEQIELHVKYSGPISDNNTSNAARYSEILVPEKIYFRLELNLSI